MQNKVKKHPKPQDAADQLYFIFLHEKNSLLQSAALLWATSCLSPAGHTHCCPSASVISQQQQQQMTAGHFAAVTNYSWEDGTGFEEHRARRSRLQHSGSNRGQLVRMLRIKVLVSARD